MDVYRQKCLFRSEPRGGQGLDSGGSGRVSVSKLWSMLGLPAKEPKTPGAYQGALL